MVCGVVYVVWCVCGVYCDVMCGVCGVWCVCVVCCDVWCGVKLCDVCVVYMWCVL